MGNLHVVMSAVSERVGPELLAGDLTPELAREVTTTLAQPGGVKPGRDPPTLEQVLEIFADTRSRLQTHAVFRQQREAIEGERRADFERRPHGRGPLAQLLDVAEGPVTPIGEASAFSDPYRDHRTYQTTVADVRWEVPSLSSGIGPFVRSLEVPINDPDYLETMVKNAAASVTDVLDPAVRDGSLFRDYAAVLRAQHRVLVDGPGGAYQGGTCARSQIPAGVFKHDGDWGADPSRSAGGLKLGLFPRGLEPPRAKIRIEGFADHELPYVTERFVMFVPMQAMPRVVDRMGELMRLAFENLESPTGLVHLSDYFHLATQSHLFFRGNNSLFMSQVNYVLERRGLLPIVHGDLDFRAYGWSYDEFRPMFLAAIAAGNSGQSGGK